MSLLILSMKNIGLVQQNYSDTFDLNRFIQFGTRIKNVKPIKIDEQLTCWKVEHEKVAAVTKETEERFLTLFFA